MVGPDPEHPILQELTSWGDWSANLCYYPPDSLAMEDFSLTAQASLPPRQYTLLHLLGALGGRIENLDFQKLLFLYCQEFVDDSPYDFVPYRLGAFSFTCYADRRKLIDRGFLARDDSRWQLTSEGASAIGHAHDEGIVSFVNRHRAFRGNRLVAECYSRFPYYAIRSEIAEKVLRDDIVTQRRIEAVRPKRSSNEVFTIGYQGKSIEHYLNTLIQEGVTLLCDVRRNAISRKYGFSKSTLRNACAGVGIRYEHLPELGINTDRRRGVKTQADLQMLLSEYERDDLPNQSSSLGTIVRWAKAGELVALTCYEADAASCHRGRVAAEIERLGGPRLSAEHLA